LNPENWGQVVQGIIERAEQEVLQKMDSNISYEGGDIDLIKGIDTVKLKKGIIPAGIVQELNAIKNKMRPRYTKGETPEYKWGRTNRAFPGKDFPGMKKVKTKKNVKKAVVVLDSSGSMWDEKTFKTLLAVAHWFNDKKILAGLYCCDTELSKCELSSSWGEIRGGGGTEFDSSHINRIISDVGQEIDIVYITDGELDLTDARKCKDVHLVIVRG
jgi:predicted metal-dependent peptidase